MDENKPICEKVRFSICCEENLSIEFTEHVKNCPDCCAYKKQHDDIKNALSGLTVPGLRSGIITESVMKTLSVDENSVSSDAKKLKPKFRYFPHAYNYVGTAAAVIVVVALFISGKGFQILNVNNSPAENTNSDNAIEYTINKSTKIEKAPDVTSDFSEIETYSSNLADSQIINENYATGVETSMEESMRFSAVSPSSAPINKENAQDDALNYPFNESIIYDSEQKKQKFSSAGGFKDSVSSKDVAMESVESEDSLDISDLLSSVVTQNTNNSIFDVSAFLQSPDSLLSNINYANSFIAENFDSENFIDYDYIVSSGIDNETFINWVSTISDYKLYDDAHLIEFAKLK